MKIKQLLLFLFALLLLSSCASNKQYDEDGNEIDPNTGEIIINENDDAVVEAPTEVAVVDNASDQYLEDGVKTESQLKEEEKAIQKQIQKKLYQNKSLEMLQNILLYDRLSKINQTSIFKEDIYINYYGNPLVIINVKSKYTLQMESATALAAKEANATKDANLTKEDGGQVNKAVAMQNPEFYNDIGVDVDKYMKDYNDADIHFEFLPKAKTIIHDMKLSDAHIELLNKLLSSSTRNEKSIVLIYTSGSKLSSEKTDLELLYKKSIYTQHIANYLYSKVSNVLIEKRFVDNIPEDELMILLYKYDGDIPVNIYNVKSSSSLEWLEQFKKLDKQRNEDAVKRNQEIEKALKEASMLASVDSKNNRKKSGSSNNSSTKPQVKRS